MNRTYVKKPLAVAVILLFISVSVVPSTGTIFEKSSLVSFDGNTLYVGGDGPGNYSKIQDAIDDAGDGDTIFVYDDSSPYVENIVIEKKSINLIGEDRNITIIDGNGSGDVVYIYATGVNISGFTIQNSGTNSIKDAGLEVTRYGEYNIISDNIIKSNYCGIFLFVAEYNNITNNIISFNRHGVCGWGQRMVGECCENTISGNIISHSKYGIRVDFGFDDGIISNNTITNNRYGLEFGSAYGNICMRNIISNNLVGISTHKSGTIITQNNFIKNIRHAKHWIWLGGLDGFGKNIWNENYWGKPREFPYPIFGRIGISRECLFPWFPQFDWHPAQEPYDIGV